MNFKKHVLFALFCITIITSSCVDPDDYDRFGRLNRSKSFFKKSYPPIDTLVVYDLKICRKKNIIRRKKLKTNGNLDINASPHVLEDRILNSLKKHFKHVVIKTKTDTIWDPNCEYLRYKTDLNNYYKLHLSKDDGYRMAITLNINYISSKNYDMSQHFGPVLHHDDMDRHDVQSTLRIALIKGNEIIYMDNMLHYDRLTTAMGEQINHDIKKETIDTLIQRGLEKYTSRIK